MTQTDTLRWPDVLAPLLRGEDLDDASASAAMAAIMDGAATPAQVAGFLVALRAKGETTEEIAGLVRTMRAFGVPVVVDGPVVDTCGTGGDRSGSFNVSTLAALTVAGAGVRVAKHGNRAASGRCGSADLLEAWGVALELSPQAVATCIDELGIGFCFAPRFHPAMRFAMPARRELGIPTVFNFLGPLTNPAGAQHQTIGVSDPTMAPRLAAVLARLGTTHALVFHGEDGLDELTTTGPSRMWEIRGDTIEESRFDPADHGIARARLADFVGGDTAENQRIADEVLSGTLGPRHDLVVVGAAAAILAADAADSWATALQAAATSLTSGAAADVLVRWAARSQELLAELLANS